MRHESGQAGTVIKAWRDRGSDCTTTPEQRDITDGDALNVLLKVLLNPATRRSFAPTDQDAAPARGHPRHPFEIRLRMDDGLPGPDDDGRPMATGPAG